MEGDTTTPVFYLKAEVWGLRYKNCDDSTLVGSTFDLRSLTCFDPTVHDPIIIPLIYDGHYDWFSSSSRSGETASINSSR